MGRRANFVIIRNGEARAFYDQWGAMGAVHEFARGPEAASGAAQTFGPTAELMDWAFAEGGYLIDFDRRDEFLLDDLDGLDGISELVPEAERTHANALDAALANGPPAFLEAIRERWQGWLLHWDDRGVDAFAAHLRERGLTSIATQPAREPASTEVHSLRA